MNLLRWLLFGSTPQVESVTSNVRFVTAPNRYHQVRGEIVDEYTPSFHPDDRFECDSRKGGCGCSWRRRDGSFHHCDKEPEIQYINPPWKERPKVEVVGIREDPYNGHERGCCYETGCCGCTCGAKEGTHKYWNGVLVWTNQTTVNHQNASGQDVLSVESVPNTMNHSTSTTESITVELGKPAGPWRSNVDLEKSRKGQGRTRG